MKKQAGIGVVVMACLVSAAFVAAQREDERQVPDIPGITTQDRRPHGCVECHRNRPDRNHDGRLTTTLKSWQEHASPKRVEMAQAAMPEGVELKGRHPDVQGLVEVVPDDCLMCHREGSDKVPAFSKLLHSIHLTGGAGNHFVMGAGGQCTACHKLDQETGTWSLGSGREN